MYIVIRMPRYCDAPFLGRMLVLTVPTFGVDPMPAISFDQGNDLTDLHYEVAPWQNPPAQLMDRRGLRGINEFVCGLSEFQAIRGFVFPKFAR